MSPIIGSRSFGRWSVSPIGDAGGPWWWGTMSVNSGYNYNDQDHSLASDDLGNIYISRGGQTTSYTQMQEVVSIANDGTFRWNRTCNGGSYLGVNGFQSAQLTTQGQAGNNSVNYNFDTTGTIILGNVIGTNSASNNVITSYPAKSGYILHKGMSQYSTDYYESLVFMSGSTKLWSKALTVYDGAYFWRNGVYYKNNYTYYWKNQLMAVIDDSGNYVYVRNLSGGETRMIGVDNDGNVYFGDYQSINKYSSSLLATWGLTISPTDTSYGNGSYSSTLRDTTGNIYHALAVGSATIRVIKVNASGTVQWVRKLTNSVISGTSYKWAFTLSKNNDLVFSMFSHSYPWLGSEYVIKLPNDGTKTGSYYPFTWAVETALTITSSTPTSSATSAGNGALNFQGTTTGFSSSSASSWGLSGNIT